jgi:acyl carrier protein
MTATSEPTLTREQVHKVLWAVAAEHSDKEVAALTPETRLVHDLGFDSLDTVEVSMEVETRLGVTVPDELMDRPELTLGDIEDALCGQQRTEPPSPVAGATG